jgi:hypothetical protein
MHCSMTTKAAYVLQASQSAAWTIGRYHPWLTGIDCWARVVLLLIASRWGGYRWESFDFGFVFRLTLTDSILCLGFQTGFGFLSNRLYGWWFSQSLCGRPLTTYMLRCFVTTLGSLWDCPLDFTSPHLQPIRQFWKIQGPSWALGVSLRTSNKEWLATSFVLLFGTFQANGSSHMPDCGCSYRWRYAEFH